MLTPEQREQRRRGVGSSDIPAIVGVSPHAAPIDVYLDKLGLSEERVTPETWCGDRAEAFIASLYVERSGSPLGHPDRTIGHDVHPWALATPDRFAHDRIVEIKLVGAGMVHLWGDAPPAHVLVQVQWQLEVCDVDRADVAALLGGTDFRIYPVERDREMGADLLDVGRCFWEEHVLARNPPPMSGEDARRLARMRYPLSMGDLLSATPEAEELRDRILRVKRHQKRVEDLRARLEARAMDMVGDAAGIKGCFSWTAPRTDGPWKAAARTMFKDGAARMWDQIAAACGDDEERWRVLAQASGVWTPGEAMTLGAKSATRRFITNEPKNGGDRR